MPSGNSEDNYVYGRWTIWPQTKFLPEEQIRVMYSDAVANGEVDEPVLEADAPLSDVCAALESAGLVTFAAENAPNSEMEAQQAREAQEREST